ncbi:MAG: metallophosphoesterase [Acidobacteria bacterium]|nr:MAG: metallophosphoesterase [Acidobacteriota bacterium]
MNVGVVSDTHGYFDPRLKELFSGVAAILHAGDVGSDEVLDELSRIAPVHAVMGNVDPDSLGLPLSRTVNFENTQVEIRHALAIPQSELEEWSDIQLLGKMQPARRDAFLWGLEPATRVVVFGHSHQPCLLAIGNRLFFNPGSAGHKRFSLPRCCGMLEVFPRGVRGSMISLGRHNERLPAKIWLPLSESTEEPS